MSDVEKEPEEFEPDDGPIILPEGARCKVCAYALAVKVPKPSKIVGQSLEGEQLFCRRFPPTPIVVPNQQGFTIIAQPPPVADDAVCYEFDAAIPTLTGFGEG